MKYFLDKLSYPGMNVVSDNLRNFWIAGNSGISQKEQIDFLIRFFNKELPIKSETQSVVENIMLEENNLSFKIWAKTGWTIDQEGNNNGWYVGLLTRKDQDYYFATNIEPMVDFDMSEFPEIRKEVTLQAFKARLVID